VARARWQQAPIVAGRGCGVYFDGGAPGREHRRPRVQPLWAIRRFLPAPQPRRLPPSDTMSRRRWPTTARSRSRSPPPTSCGSSVSAPASKASGSPKCPLTPIPGVSILGFLGVSYALRHCASGADRRCAREPWQL